MNTEAYKKAILSIKTRSGTLTKDIHKAALAAMIFSATDIIGGTKNATPAMQLCQALAAGMQRNEVVAWFHHFTNVRMTVNKQKDGTFKWSCKNLAPTIKDKDTGVVSPNPEYVELDADLLKEAAKTPYWDLNPQRDVNEVDIESMIRNAIKRIEKAQENGKLKDAPANAQRLAGLRALVTGTAASAQEVPFDNPTAELVRNIKAAGTTVEA